jgi:leucyl/phenylalanyl-tRNA--protein transferase
MSAFAGFWRWLDEPQPALRLELVRIVAPLAILGFMSSRIAHADEWIGDGGFHVPGTLAAVVRQNKFECRINSDFESTMRACMQQRAGGTWISEPLIRAYGHLHELGFAHSVESWQDGHLVGGLYGVSLGGAFFGESMFHFQRDASKVALVHLVNRLRERGYELLDTQASTQHLRRFGCIDIRAEQYMKLLRNAIAKPCRFNDE